MLILVSNDDGIDSPGIQQLAKKLKRFAEVVVVAPDREQSAASHSITLHRPLRVTQVKSGFYAVHGTPTDCITLGVFEILKKKPDWVVSGINRGGNLGDDVHYSGTVSAAVEGAMIGIPSIAFSLMTREQKHSFEVASSFAAKFVRKISKRILPPGMVLNVNFPDLPREKIKGFQVCTLGKRNYSDIIVENLDPRGKPYYWLGGSEMGFDDIEGSDGNAIQAGYIPVTPINIKMTDYQFLEKMREWKW